MKKLQKSFTTAEQSKRLLELGVPANSAEKRVIKVNGVPQEHIIIKTI